MRDFIIFDGISSLDFGVYVFPKKIDNAPKRDVQRIKVPGRNGYIIIDNDRYEDVYQSYTGIIIDPDKFDEYMSLLRSSLLGSSGYKRLEDTFKPDEYRMGYLDKEFTPKVVSLWRKMGKFELNFVCKPQRFLKIGEGKKEFTSNGDLYNPTIFPAKPFIRVYSNNRAYGSVVIGGNTLSIARHTDPYIDIDCDRMDAYYYTANCNNLLTITGDFPVLEQGYTSIELASNSISKVEITPNWWTL